jgi:ubiquinol-cytochrome c reductase cytochrome c subunit
MRLLSLRAAVAVAVTIVVTAPAWAEGDAVKGRDIYVKKGCWSCHGYNGQGAVSGPKIAPDPMPLDALIAFLRNAASTRMPPYDATGLPDAEIADIHAYLVSLPKPADWRSLPLLQP